MQSLFIFAVWASLLALGIYAPFVLGIAFVWVDLFRPQDVAPSIGGIFSMSLITALLALSVYFVFDRRSPPPPNLLTFLLFLWAIWITLTTVWSEVPTHAWIKWDWAFKTIVFSILLTFVFRSRIQVEALIFVIVFSVFSNVIPFALKTLIDSGGYSRPLGLVPINSGWGGEGSTLSTYAIACIPLIFFLRKHSILLPDAGPMRVAYAIAPLLAIFGAFGTFARAGLVACAVWGAITWWQARRKLLIAAALCIGAAAAVPIMGDRWLDRMSTTTNPTEEASAFTRLIVWGWTIEYARANPLGGGFDVYRINRRTVTLDDGTEFEMEGRAFHSLYFEILGEHGFVGFFLFFLIIAVFYVNMVRLIRRTRDDAEHLWLADLARALMTSVTAYLAGAAFVGIAFQPLHYYFLVLSVAASAYLVRARQAAASSEPGSRSQTSGTTAPPHQPAAVGSPGVQGAPSRGWRTSAQAPAQGWRARRSKNPSGADA